MNHTYSKLNLFTPGNFIFFFFYFIQPLQWQSDQPRVNDSTHSVCVQPHTNPQTYHAQTAITNRPFDNAFWCGDLYISFHLQTISSSKYKRTNQKAANIDTTLFNKSSHTRSNILFCFTEMFDSHLRQIASFMLCTLYEIQTSTLPPCHVQLKNALGRTQLSWTKKKYYLLQALVCLLLEVTIQDLLAMDDSNKKVK